MDNQSTSQSHLENGLIPLRAQSGYHIVNIIGFPLCSYNSLYIENANIKINSVSHVTQPNIDLYAKQLTHSSAKQYRVLVANALTSRWLETS
jgi:hypothetical protein